MKNTGIVRRIDDLGRIVVPKEIRRNLQIKEGAPLELWIDDDKNIVLKKYNETANMVQLVQDLSSEVSNVYENSDRKNSEGTRAFQEVISQVRELKENIQLLAKTLDI